MDAETRKKLEAELKKLKDRIDAIEYLLVVYEDDNILPPNTELTPKRINTPKKSYGKRKHGVTEKIMAVIQQLVSKGNSVIEVREVTTRSMAVHVVSNDRNEATRQVGNAMIVLAKKGRLKKVEYGKYAIADTGLTPVSTNGQAEVVTSN